MENCLVCEDEIFKGRDGKYKIKVQNGNWDYYNDDFDCTYVEIRFCYWCGKDYRQEEVEE